MGATNTHPATANGDTKHVDVEASALPPVSIIPALTPVHIYGIGVEYPPDFLHPADLESLVARFYPLTPAVQKTLAINRATGIARRSVVHHATGSFLTTPVPPTIADTSASFRSAGVALAVRAAHKALSEWSGPLSSITHMVSVTVCDTSNPGFDYHVASALGLSPHVERTLLHGIGCTGGLAVLRTAANLVLAAKAVGQTANVLCVVSEVTSLFYRNALEEIVDSGNVNPGVTLFSDCATAMVVSSSSPAPPLYSQLAPKKPIYSIRAFTSTTLPSTSDDLRIPVSPLGFNAHMSRRVPAVTSASTPPLLAHLLSSLSSPLQPAQLDWALHPGGAAVISAVQSALGLSAEDHTRASWEVYRDHGNSGAATIGSVLERMRGERYAKREDVVGVAFGPGVRVEMMMFKRA